MISTPEPVTARPTIPVIPGSVLEPAPDLRSVDGGRVLIGGSPLTIVRLSQAGAELARRWFAGDPIEDRPAHHAMARRLESNGMAHLRPPGPAGDGPTGRGPFTVVIPVRDDRSGLERTLRSLDGLGELGGVVVIDDGSRLPLRADRAPLDRAAIGTEVRIVRRDRSGGPAAARQQAVSGLHASIVVFVDAGVAVAPATLAELAGAFDDPAVVAAAPRVVSEQRPHPVGRYDGRRSPLDLGPVESLVGPGRAVPYVPTACLAVRTDALQAVGGFDVGLRFGEDVDLVWRLSRVGNIRYLPGLTASHRPRATMVDFAGQRRSYGSAAAPLAARHGAEAVSPCRISPWSMLVTGLVICGHPVVAGVTALGTGLALRPKIEPLPDATAEAVGLTLRGHWYGARSLLTAVARTWAPLLPVAYLLAGSRRRRILTLAAAAFGRRLLDGPRRPGPALVDLGLGAVDDLAYGVGVWEGAIEERSTAALRPVLSSWPGGGPGLRSGLADLAGRIRAWPGTR